MKWDWDGRILEREWNHERLLIACLACPNVTTLDRLVGDSMNAAGSEAVLVYEVRSAGDIGLWLRIPRKENSHSTAK
jgi:hypothetical protein